MSDTPTSREAIESAISERLTKLENAVEQSTSARMNGRTMNNRLIHGEAVTEIADLVDAAVVAAKEEQIMQDFLTLLDSPDVFFDESDLIEWRQTQFKDLHPPIQGGSDE